MFVSGSCWNVKFLCDASHVQAINQCRLGNDVHLLTTRHTRSLLMFMCTSRVKLSFSKTKISHSCDLDRKYDITSASASSTVCTRMVWNAPFAALLSSPSIPWMTSRSRLFSGAEMSDEMVCVSSMAGESKHGIHKSQACNFGSRPLILIQSLS